MSLLMLDDGNHTELLLAPTVERAAVDKIRSAYSWNHFNAYDNRFWEYSSLLLDPVFEQVRDPLETFWLQLTRPQKVVLACWTFAGQTDNGGVWQFLFNYPALSLAALEAFEEIGAEALSMDYRATLEEAVGKSESIQDLRRRANQHGPTENRWAAFTEGYDQLQKAKVIEDYFYSEQFKKQFYRQLCDHIEARLELFARINESDGT